MKILKIFSGISQKKASQIKSAKPLQTTVKINEAGNRVLDRISNGWHVNIEQIKIPNGVKRITKIFILGDKKPSIEETKTFITEKNASVFGGKKQTISRDYKISWGYVKNNVFTKSYDEHNVLEHKHLIEDVKIDAERNFHNEATQERVLNSKLNNSILDMFKKPKKNKQVLHQLNGENNFSKFNVEKTRYEELSEKQ